ncbi:MAG: Lactoylglutathione lyase [Acidobacteria bacterium]|nr:Lactoylglutathione lyase [Acidobacteriota bacterium]
MMINGTQNQPVQALKAHLALNVSNVEQSLEFYRKLWGIEPSKVRTGYAKFDVQNPPLNLTINQAGFTGRGALSHLGIQVASTEDVYAVRERWIQVGLLPRDEMQTSCCYALQDKAWVRDPDGNEWEVFVVLKDHLAETASCECGDKVTSSPAETGSREASASSATPDASCCSPAPVGIAR